MGPGAGEHGGGWWLRDFADIMRSPESLTGQYLSEVKQIPVPSTRRPGSGEAIVIKGQDRTT